MVKVSIVSLIYKSPKFADWVYNSVQKFTPQIKRGEAEFFFVANDASPAVLEYLRTRRYPHIVNNNPILSEADLFKIGYGWPEYIHRVYQGWNRAIIEAKGEIVVLINSDNYFSPDWLENLLKYVNRERVVCSQLVERKHPKYDIFPGAYHQDFGNHPDNFKEKEFLEYVEKIKKTGLQENGAYMPCAFYKDMALQVGLYPEGNIAGKTFNEIVIYGDAFFFKMLKRIGVNHYTALDSIVYHLKEGEMDATVPKLKAADHKVKIQVREASDPQIIREKTIALYKKMAASEIAVNMLYYKAEAVQAENYRLTAEVNRLRLELEHNTNELIRLQGVHAKLEIEFQRLLKSKAVRLSNKIKRGLAKIGVKKFK